MKKLFIFTIFNFTLLIAFAQSPQSFKYQAVIRDSGGEILVNQTVGLQVSILEGSETVTAIYVEEWNTETNDYGIVNINIGEGSSPDNFSEINWGTNSYFVKISLDETGGNSYTDMGTSQLLSVPYALYANESANGASHWVNNTNGISYNEGNVGIITTGAGIDPELPLFEVRNNAGDVVFAVYNEGIRMNVDNASSSHDRGGFAIGGQNQDKGLLDYFQVTPDSVRIYLDEAVSPSDRGGFAIGGQNQDKTITGEYMFINTDSTRITTAEDGGFGVISKTGNTGFVDITPSNLFIGPETGINNTNGMYNSFIGHQSGKNNSEGYKNLFLGYNAGLNNTEGFQNVFIGNESGLDNNIGSQNVFIGNEAGKMNTTAYANIFIGNLAGTVNTTGGSNIFIGEEAGFSSKSSQANVAIGVWAGHGLIDGSLNLFLGNGSGISNVSGTQNLFIGNWAGTPNTGSNNVFLGSYSGWIDGDFKLAISSTETANPMALPLIYGEFDNHILTFNTTDGGIEGRVNINDVMNITPRSTVPSDPQAGDIYFGTDNVLHIYDGTQWNTVNMTPE